jgi:hypothetical protein
MPQRVWSLAERQSRWGQMARKGTSPQRQTMVSGVVRLDSSGREGEGFVDAAVEGDGGGAGGVEGAAAGGAEAGDLAFEERAVDAASAGEVDVRDGGRWSAS